MKTTKNLGMLAACALLLMQSCTKNEAFTTRSKGSGPSLKRVDVTGTIATGSYKIITGVSGTDAKTIGPVGASTANNALIEQRAFFSDKGQEWSINSKGGGEYTIININSGKALEVPFANAFVGAELWQNAPDGDNDAQRWIITEQATAGEYRIAAKLKTSAGETVGLTVENGSTANGAKIILQKFINNNSIMKINRVAYVASAPTQFFQRASGWIAGDGSCSVHMSNGKVIWMMDDSNIDTYTPGNGTMSCDHAMVNNAAIIQEHDNWVRADAITALGSGGGSLADSEPGNAKYNWLYAGFQSGSYVYWKASTISAGTDVGPDRFAKYEIATRSMVAYPLMPGTGDKTFGNGFVVEGDSVYAYGTKNGFIVADVYVARFHKDAPTDPWKFWNGTGWVSTPGTAVSIGQSASYVPFVSKIGSKYVLVSNELSVECGGGNSIYTATSNSPTGPFSDPRKEVYRIPDKYNGVTARFYWSMAHPEYINSKNEVLFTYNVNSGDGTAGCGTACVFGREDPNRYRPRAIWVPLKLIDPTY